MDRLGVSLRTKEMVEGLRPRCSARSLRLGRGGARVSGGGAAGRFGGRLGIASGVTTRVPRSGGVCRPGTNDGGRDGAWRTEETEDRVGESGAVGFGGLGDKRLSTLVQPEGPRSFWLCRLEPRRMQAGQGTFSGVS